MNFLVARAQESKIIYLYTRFVYYEGTTTFGQKSTTFYFCFRSMQKPSKRVKTKLFNLCALPCLWLTLTVYFDLA